MLFTVRFLLDSRQNTILPTATTNTLDKIWTHSKQQIGVCRDLGDRPSANIYFADRQKKAHEKRQVCECFIFDSRKDLFCRRQKAGLPRALAFGSWQRAIQITFEAINYFK
jgi:hypothetical protein